MTIVNANSSACNGFQPYAYLRAAQEGGPV